MFLWFAMIKERGCTGERNASILLCVKRGKSKHAEGKNDSENYT